MDEVMVVNATENFINSNIDKIHAAVSAVPGVVRNVIEEMQNISSMDNAQVSDMAEEVFDRIASEARKLAEGFRRIPRMEKNAAAADRSANTFESLTKQVKEEKGLKKLVPALKLIIGYIFKIAVTILKGALTVAFWTAVIGIKIICIAGEFVVKLLTQGYKQIRQKAISLKEYAQPSIGYSNAGAIEADIIDV